MAGEVGECRMKRSWFILKYVLGLQEQLKKTKQFLRIASRTCYRCANLVFASCHRVRRLVIVSQHPAVDSSTSHCHTVSTSLLSSQLGLGFPRSFFTLISRVHILFHTARVEDLRLTGVNGTECRDSSTFCCNNTV
jgi:hypothetical protein